MNDTVPNQCAVPSAPRTRRLRLLGPALILLASLAAVSPQLLRGPSCGHDFTFHFFSWVDAQHSWREGILYPRWAASPDYGAGEPRFIFYPPLSWMAGAALGDVLPWHLVPIALSFLILAGIGLATRALAREVMDDAPATLAGCAAMLLGYAPFTAYERTAFAELTGGIWIPLILLLMLRDRHSSASAWRRALDGSAALLALPLAAAWLSDAPLGVMAVYLLAGTALLLALLARSWAPVLRAAVGTVLGLGLAAAYILPAAWEEKWVAIRRTTGDLGDMVQGSWLFARHSDPNLAAHDFVLHQVSVIVVAMVALTVAGVLVSWWRGRLPGPRRWWLPLAIIPAVVLFLQLSVSLSLWNLLPEMRFMQFPWRWLVVLEAPMGIFFAATVWPVARRRQYLVAIICALLFTFAATWAGRFWFQPCYPEDSVASMLSQYQSGAVLNDSDEYAPPGSDDSLLALGLPDACLVSNPSTPLGKENDNGVIEWHAAQRSCEATYTADSSERSARARHLLIHANIGHPGFLILRLRTYPAWLVRVNGKPVANLPRREDGLMAVPVPEGPVAVSVVWRTTPDIIAGAWLSCLCVVAISGLYLLERKQNAARLSLLRCLPT